ncbi:uncharacterized protein BJ171DRAFT_513400 [Polychytrium aggregatum]|uniref:uncharacterized protein n=1 Tax=Polychytrium aggregatum TaxID=110093 RepID=UPI0022FF0CF4|nr:uncharacterized protein BJ171DRAFT_513400 [Polychytrium aggregatum]KAI9202552.1 hypothetical protein BJ171DRAFT_513400 [Polychytrium aggregatum]
MFLKPNRSSGKLSNAVSVSSQDLPRSRSRGSISPTLPDQTHKPMARIMFEKYDIDGSGSISIHEFRKLCYDLGYYLSDKELEIDIKLLDVNGDREITYDEFIKWWMSDHRFKMLQLTPEDYVQLQKACQDFQKFDKDDSGCIDIREFRGLYNDLVKKNMAPSSLTATLQQIDTNKDGKVSFNEYVYWLVEGRLNPPLSRRKSTDAPLRQRSTQ